ncbi:MAG: lycopene cyclase domain-containing protein [Myxococcota bacterium]
MTYLDIHTLFMVIPTAAFLRYWRFQEPSLTLKRGIGSIFALAFLATVWTMPWDNLMVIRGVWTYPPEGVLGLVFHIPIEEQMFFVLQPLFTGLWMLMLAPEGPPRAPRPPWRWAVNIIGALSWLVVGGIAAYASTMDAQWYYAGTFLAWFSIPLAIQWGYGLDKLWSWRKLLLAGIGPTTMYLCLLDAIALRYRVWSISAEHTTSWHIGPLPIEEALFFLLTNVLVVQGLTLLLDLLRQLDGRAR